MAKNPFNPLQIAGTGGAATPEDVNRVQEQIRQAFGKLTPGGLVKVTSKDGTVSLTPKSGTGTVDLSVAPITIATGGSAISLGSAAPGPLDSSVPELYQKVTIGGADYVFPLWKLKKSSGGSIPDAGLLLWVKGDAGVTLSGSTITGWADQSGNGNDLSTSNAPAFDGTGFDGVPAPSFNRTADTWLGNAAFPWSATLSVFVVFQLPNTPAGAGRLVDWYYPSDNRQIELTTSGGVSDVVSSWVSADFTVLNNTTICCVLTFDGTTASLYNGDLSTPVGSSSGSYTPATGVRIGSLPGFGQGTDSLVAEFGIYDHALGSTELTALQAYFTARGYL